MHPNRGRQRSARTAAILSALLLAVVGCSRDPTGSPESRWVVFERDSLELGRVRVGRDTTVSLDLSFASAPQHAPLHFAMTDPHFRVEPAVWAPPQPRPERLRVHFTTTAADSYATWVQVLAGGNVIAASHVQVVAWSPWASLHVSRGRVDFGRIEPASRVDRTVSVRNSSLASLPCTLEVRTPIPEILVNPERIVLPPGRSLALNLSLLCREEGRHEGDLEILSNDPFQRRIRIELIVECRGVPEIAGLPDTLDFARTAVHVGKTRPLVVSNPGNGRLRMDVASIPGDISLSQTTVEVAPGDSALLQVRWIPRATGPFSGRLAWRTDTEEGEISMALAGTAVPGIQPARGLGGIDLEMTPIDALREFGPPEGEQYHPPCLSIWFYDSVEDAILFPAEPQECLRADSRRAALEVSGWGAFAGRTAGGVGMGSTAGDIRGEFGPPEIDQEDGRTRWLVYPSRGIIFRLDSERVSLVDVFRPEDWKADKLGIRGARGSWGDAHH